VAALIVNEGLCADLLDRDMFPNSAWCVAMFHDLGPFFHDGGSYFGVTATLAGLLAPAPEYGELLSTAPLLVNALTGFAPLFATQTLPEPSIAMLAGAFRPLPANTEPLVPAELSLVIELLPEFATQALPLVSMAMAEGALNPPAVKPLEVESAEPVASSLVTLLLPLLVTHTAPAASVAIEVGELSPPPV